MAAAGVRIQEIDRSTRVPGFAGVYAAITFPAKKGPLDRPMLVTNDAQLLSVYTPDEKIDVGFDLGYFSALAYLAKSDKLWIQRIAKQAKFGGLVLKTTGSAYANFALATGLTDPSAYVFDAGVDVAAVAEVTQFTFSQLGSFYDVIGTAKAIQLFNSPAVGHYFWFNVTDGANTPQTDPVLVGTGHQVDVLAADTAAQVATKFFTQVALVVAAFTATNAVAAQVIVTNVTVGTASNASATGTAAAVVISTQGAAAITTVDEAILIHGANEGAWNNSIAVKVTNYVTNPDLVKEVGAFLIQVFKLGNTATPVESFICSRVEGAKDGFGQNIYIEDVLESSNYIRAIDNVAVANTVTPKDQASVLYMAQGDDGLATTDVEFIAGSDMFRNKDELPVTLFMDAGHATAPYGQNLDAIAAARYDSVAILSTPISAEASASYIDDLKDYRQTTLSLNSSFSSLYTPHVLIYDRFNDRRIYVSPDGYAAAAISSTAANFELWFPPAGFKRGTISVLDLRRRFTRAEMGALYDVGINPIRFATGKGIAIWGQKTLLTRPSALDRLNVRLLLVAIEPAVEAFLEDFTFDFNDAETRSFVTAGIDQFMTGILARRGVTGFDVICDESNNTPAVIDNNQMIVDLYVQPNKSAEDIVFRVIIQATGA